MTVCYGKTVVMNPERVNSNCQKGLSIFQPVVLVLRRKTVLVDSHSSHELCFYL